MGVFVLLFHGPLQAQGAIFGSHVLMWARLHSSCVALCRLRGLYIRIRWSHGGVGAFALLLHSLLQAQGAIFGGHMMMWTCLRSSHGVLIGLRALAVFSVLNSKYCSMSVLGRKLQVNVYSPQWLGNQLRCDYLMSDTNMVLLSKQNSGVI